MKEQSNLSDEELKELQEAIRKDCPDMDGKSDDEIRKEAKEYIAREHPDLIDVIKESRRLYYELFPKKPGDGDMSDDDVLDDVVSGVKDFYKGNPDAPTKFSDKPTVEWFVDAYVKSWKDSLDVLKSIKKNLAVFEKWKNGSAGQRNLYDAAHRILPLEQYVQEHPTDYVNTGNTGWKQYLYLGVLKFLKEFGTTAEQYDKWTDDDESRLKQYLFPKDTRDLSLDVQSLKDLSKVKNTLLGRRVELSIPRSKLNIKLTTLDEKADWGGGFGVMMDDEGTELIGKYIMADGTSPDPFERIVENILGAMYFEAKRHPNFNGKVVIDPITVYRNYSQAAPHTPVIEENVQRVINAIRNLMGGYMELDMRQVLDKWEVDGWTLEPVIKGQPVTMFETLMEYTYYDKKTKTKCKKTRPAFILMGPPVNYAVAKAIRHMETIPDGRLNVPKKKSTFTFTLVGIQLWMEIAKMKSEQMKSKGKHYNGQKSLDYLYYKFFKIGRPSGSPNDDDTVVCQPRNPNKEKLGPQGEDKDRQFRDILSAYLNYWKDKGDIKDWEFVTGNRGLKVAIQIYLFPLKPEDKLRDVNPRYLE